MSQIKERTPEGRPNITYRQPQHGASGKLAHQSLTRRNHHEADSHIVAGRDPIHKHTSLTTRQRTPLKDREKIVSFELMIRQQIHSTNTRSQKQSPEVKQQRTHYDGCGCPAKLYEPQRVLTPVRYPLDKCQKSAAMSTSGKKTRLNQFSNGNACNQHRSTLCSQQTKETIIGQLNEITERTHDEASTYFATVFTVREQGNADADSIGRTCRATLIRRDGSHLIPKDTPLAKKTPL